MGKDTIVSFGIISLTDYLCLMTGIDLILGGILLYGLIKGLWKGLFIELASLVSLLLGIYLAIKFSGVVGSLFDSQLPDDPGNAAIVSLLLFIGYYFAGTTLLKRIFFGGMFVALLAIVVAILSAVFVKSHAAKERPAIVFAEVIAVKSEPMNNSEDAFVLHEGTKVYVTEEVDNYKKIVLADDNVGWIESSAIKELKQ